MVETIYRTEEEMKEEAAHIVAVALFEIVSRFPGLETHTSGQHFTFCSPEETGVSGGGIVTTHFRTRPTLPIRLSFEWAMDTDIADRGWFTYELETYCVGGRLVLERQEGILAAIHEFTATPAAADLN